MENLLGNLWREVPMIGESAKITDAMLGAVAMKNDDGTWTCFIGVVGSTNADEQKDIETITEHGARLTEQEAQRWFPLIELPYKE